MKQGELTKADRDALEAMPDGWFVPIDLPHWITRPIYRCDRLAKSGQLEWRVVGTFPALESQYRRVIPPQSGGEEGKA